jgi:class 3 adenylate cyclase
VVRRRSQPGAGDTSLRDLVGFTEVASRLGDGAWRDLLSQTFESTRAELERFGGRKVKTTGDGRAMCSGDEAHRARAPATNRRDVGEVEMVGDDVRGVSVHEAARIMAAADPDEILVSDLTRALAAATGLAFDDRGVHTLKGLDGEWHLAAFVEGGSRPRDPQVGARGEIRTTVA